MPGSLGELRALGGQVLARRKPWAKLIEPQRFAAPHTVADVNARLRQNLQEFQANYAVFLVSVLAVALLFNPGSAAVRSLLDAECVCPGLTHVRCAQIVGLLAAGWAVLLTHADVALVVRGRTVTRTEQLGLAAAASLGARPPHRATAERARIRRSQTAPTRPSCCRAPRWLRLVRPLLTHVALRSGCALVQPGGRHPGQRRRRRHGCHRGPRGAAFARQRRRRERRGGRRSGARRSSLAASQRLTARLLRRRQRIRCITAVALTRKYRVQAAHHQPACLTCCVWLRRGMIRRRAAPPWPAASLPPRRPARRLPRKQRAPPPARRYR